MMVLISSFGEYGALKNLLLKQIVLHFINIIIDLHKVKKFVETIKLQNDFYSKNVDLWCVLLYLILGWVKYYIKVLIYIDSPCRDYTSLCDIKLVNVYILSWVSWCWYKLCNLISLNVRPSDINYFILKLEKKKNIIN